MTGEGLGFLSATSEYNISNTYMQNLLIVVSTTISIVNNPLIISVHSSINMKLPV
jgi:hypothetical protein